MESTSAQRAKKRPLRWQRHADGRYSVFGVMALEPHVYRYGPGLNDCDVYDAKRVREIFRETVRRRPRGVFFVGHANDGAGEQPAVGDIGNYRMTPANRVLADLIEVEPGVMLDIALKRLRAISIEFEFRAGVPPDQNFRVIEGAAALGRSRPFFDSATLDVDFSDSDLAQLRADAETWPAVRRARSKAGNWRSWRRYAGADSMSDHRRYRWKMTDKGLALEVPDESTESGWRGMRAGESVAIDDAAQQFSELRGLYEEAMGRIQVMEEKLGRNEMSPDDAEDEIGVNEAGDVDGDTTNFGDDDATREAPDGDDDGGADDVNVNIDADGDDSEDEDEEEMANKRQRQRPTGNNAMRRQIESLTKWQREQERQSAETAIHAQIDAAVASGRVVPEATRKAVVRAALREPANARRSFVDAMLANARAASLADDTSSADLALEVPDGGDDEYRQLLASLNSAGRSRAKELSKTFDELAAEGSKSTQYGRAYFVRTNLDKRTHYAKPDAARR